MPAKAANAKYLEASLKALELNEMLPEVHSLMGVLKATHFDWKGAEREFRRAIELGPKIWDVWMHYTFWYLLPMRRMDEAIVAMQSAVELDPLSPMPQFQLGTVYYVARQYDRAIEQYRNTLELSPHFGPAYIFLGITLILAGKSNEGIEAIETGVPFLGRSPYFLAILGFAYAQAGLIGDAQKLLAELQDLAQKAYVSPFHFAAIYVGLGDLDKSFDWFEKAVEERDFLTPMLPVFPEFDPLRSHPRYHALLRKMNLIEP